MLSSSPVRSAVHDAPDGVDCVNGAAASTESVLGGLDFVFDTMFKSFLNNSGHDFVQAAKERDGAIVFLFGGVALFVD